MCGTYQREIEGWEEIGMEPWLVLIHVSERWLQQELVCVCWRRIFAVATHQEFIYFLERGVDVL